MTPIDEFMEQWINGQIRKFRAEIEEWDQPGSIYDCDFCGLGPGDCDCGGCE